MRNILQYKYFTISLAKEIDYPKLLEIIWKIVNENKLKMQIEHNTIVKLFGSFSNLFWSCIFIISMSVANQ